MPILDKTDKKKTAELNKFFKTSQYGNYYQSPEACLQDHKKRKSAIRKIPVPLAEQVHRVPESGNGDRHHLHQDSMGHDVFYGRD